MAKRCRFVQVLSNSAASHISREGRNEQVENVKSLQRRLSRMSQSSRAVRNAWQNDIIGQDEIVQLKVGWSMTF